MTRVDRDLVTRMRAQCCSISGLTDEELNDHARNVAQTLTRIRTKNQARRHSPQRQRRRAQTEGV